MSVCNNQFQTFISRSIVRCYMWYICSFRSKIRIHSHIVWYFLRPKSLFNGILSFRTSIRSEDGFKYVFLIHRNCNNYYVNISFNTKFKVKIFCSLVIFYFLPFGLTSFKFLCARQTLLGNMYQFQTMKASTLIIIQAFL